MLLSRGKCLAANDFSGLRFRGIVALVRQSVKRPKSTVKGRRESTGMQPGETRFIICCQQPSGKGSL